MEPAIAIAPVIALDDYPPAASVLDLQSGWVSVEPYPQHVEASTTLWEDAAATPPDPPSSAVSRQRTLKAQRQLQMTHSSNSFSSVPVKQETEHTVSRPRDLMQSWDSSSTPYWSSQVSSFCSTRRSPDDMARTYPNPLAGISGLGNYNFQHFQSSSMATSPLVVPSVPSYPAQSLLEQTAGLPPACYEQLDGTTTFSSMPMSSGDISLSTGLESCTLNMQQSGVFDSW